MKNAKRTLTLLLTAAMLSTCLLPFTGCKSTTAAPESPFNDVLPSDGEKEGDKNGDTEDTNPPSNTEPDADWAKDSSVGEKRLYGKLDNDLYGIARYGDILIGNTNANKLGYFSFDQPDGAHFLCFDPICRHIVGDESCSAIINDYQFSVYQEEDRDYYPSDMYFDLYESVDGPVIYFCYRRSKIYTISVEESGTREPVYCIERFDFSKGKREIVLDDVENVIEQTCTYGDYVYYVLDRVEDGQELYRIPKTGGESEKYDYSEKAGSLRIIDVVDDMFYYLVNERYLYRAELDLTGSEMVLDISTVKGENDSNGIIKGSYCEYLYYFADYETVWSGEPEDSISTQKANLYRIPMNDLTQEPQKVVEGLSAESGYGFAEHTFYYTPCVFKYSTGGETPINECDGKLYALDLESGESKLIVENSGMTIYPCYVWDDRVFFSGWAYEASGKRYSGDCSNLLVAYTSGEPFEIYNTNKFIFGRLETE